MSTLTEEELEGYMAARKQRLEDDQCRAEDALYVATRAVEAADVKSAVSADAEFVAAAVLAAAILLGRDIDAIPAA